MAWRIGCLILANDLGLQENLQAFLFLEHALRNRDMFGVFSILSKKF